MLRNENVIEWAEWENEVNATAANGWYVFKQEKIATF